MVLVSPSSGKSAISASALRFKQSLSRNGLSGKLSRLKLVSDKRPSRGSQDLFPGPSGGDMPHVCVECYPKLVDWVGQSEENLCGLGSPVSEHSH
jgi:hypothetical protein